MYALREVFDAVRWMAKAACPWRLLPGDFPPWQVVEQQSKRWIKAGVFEAMVHDLRMIIRRLHERAEQPTAAVLDGRTLQSSPESGARAGYDGYKRKKGSKVHIAVDTLGHLLALVVTPANEQERAQVAALAEQVQQATAQSVELAFVDQGYTGNTAAEAAAAHGIQLEVVQTRRRQARASCSCPAAGSSNAPLPGWLVFGGSRVTTNGYQPRLPGCTGWPSPVFYSTTCSGSTTKVNDRL